VHADGEFAPLKSLIESIPGGLMVDLASANEHVPAIERRIRVVKELCPATRHSLPFEIIPKLTTVHIVLNVVKLLNLFPTKGGVSDTLSPKTIMSRETLDFKKHLSLQIGLYCQVHKEETPRNSQISHTKGAISPGFKFMALNSGNKIVRCSWGVISMPDIVIARVNVIGSDQPHQMTFKDRHGRLIGNIEIPVVDADEDDNDDSPGVEPVIVDDIEIPGVDVAGPEALDEFPTQQVEIDDLDITHDDPAPIEEVPAQSVPMSAPVAPPSAPKLRRSTRARTQATQGYTPSMTGSKYSYAVTQLDSQGVLNPDAHMFVQEDLYQAEPDIVAAIMTQLSLKTGLKEWGDQASTAAQSEMKQFNFRKTFNPKYWQELSKSQRHTMLESHMFLKLERDGRIKGRTVAGENKQRDSISKEDASSPTVAP
jgi:hypothetical protein